MELLRTVAAVRSWRTGRRGPAGFVPTMGYLHEGHLSLVRRARSENQAVIASIFVNPTQFRPGEDFERYPRDEARDLELLEAENTDVVFLPAVEEIYPEGFCTFVDVGGGLTDVLEGAARPGHFRGVATVVAKLFNIVGAERAYFGRKDAQQLTVIRRMVNDLNLPIEVVPCPTVREPDGLAMSSRNVYLSPQQRRAAPALFAALRDTQARFAAGERSAEALRAAVRAKLSSEPLVELDYISIADPETLEETEEAQASALASLAARLGSTRLIDNLILGEY